MHEKDQRASLINKYKDQLSGNTDLTSSQNQERDSACADGDQTITIDEQI